MFCSITITFTILCSISKASCEPQASTHVLPGPTSPGVEAITKLHVAHQAPQKYLQPLLAFCPLTDLPCLWRRIPFFFKRVFKNRLYPEFGKTVDVVVIQAKPQGSVKAILVSTVKIFYLFICM
jgi:hypothetical protein